MIPSTCITDFFLERRADTGNVDANLMFLFLEDIEQPCHVAMGLPWCVTVSIVVRPVKEEAQMKLRRTVEFKLLHAAR
ncbi:hypothetical protein ACQCP0_19655 [Ralstonia pseudosolanacearum]|uniref:hypothetical protein n=1 Tax=Ralstonia solanacearum species complex TaxID=3116862 RepID=UPI001CB98E44|nr:hypothetical protein [Ralstonia pseudosolanacearum]